MVGWVNHTNIMNTYVLYCGALITLEEYKELISERN